MIRTISVSLFFVFSTLFSFAQTIRFIDPPNWFSGLKTDELYLLLVGDDLVNLEDVEVNYPGISVRKWDPMNDHNKYASLVLRIEKTVQPGTFEIVVKGKKKTKISYELKARNSYQAQSLSQQDLIYNIELDRFVNGNTENDSPKGFLDKKINTKSDSNRHGGDLKGLQLFLEYPQSLGATAVSLSPVLECNQKSNSYQGLAPTHSYKMDARFGSTSDLTSIINQLHQSNMKFIQEMQFNQWGNQHYLVQNKPSERWFHQASDHNSAKQSSPEVLLDPHVSYIDKNQFNAEKIALNTVDLNQENERLENYLIQQTIWWVETYQIDAIKVLQYAQTDQIFLRIWRDRLLEEYPSLFVYADIGIESGLNAVTQSWFIGESGLNKEFHNHLESVVDQQLEESILLLMEENEDAVYEALSADFLLLNPENLVLELPEADTAHYFDLCNQGLDKYKMGVGLLATLRGIPEWKSGTEFLRSNHSLSNAKYHNWNAGERDSLQQLAFDYTQKLFQWRAKNNAVAEGRLLQFAPKDGVYTFFRHTADEIVMVTVNTSSQSKVLDLARFNEIVVPKSKAVDVISNEEYSVFDTWKLKPNEIRITSIQE